MWMWIFEINVIQSFDGSFAARTEQPSSGSTKHLFDGLVNLMASPRSYVCALLSHLAFCMSEHSALWPLYAHFRWKHKSS